MKSIKTLHRVWLAGSLILTAMTASGQNRLGVNASVGYFGENLVRPGIVANIELERYVGAGVSLPTSAAVVLINAPDYYGIYLGIHTGFRKYLGSRLFVEQSVGVGAMANIFTVDSIWYVDPFGTAFRYAVPIYGFVPAVSVGAGINVGPENGHEHLIWVRPTVYWNLGIRGIHLPYAALQIGYSINIRRGEE